jgi:hypothetical protein
MEIAPLIILLWLLNIQTALLLRIMESDKGSKTD